MSSKLAEAVHSLPRHDPKSDIRPASMRRSVLRGSDTAMRTAGDTVIVLEEKLRNYEEELLRLRVENDQLRRSSQAFGELAERLSIALRTATRADRRSTAADCGGRRRPVAES
jgi:hypothetical protein